MFKTVYLTDDLSKLTKDGYKLCYIDSIDRTYYDYTPAAKAYSETEEYKALKTKLEEVRDKLIKKQGYASTNDSELSVLYNSDIMRKATETTEYDNPDYIPGEQEYFAYFTPVELSEQTGDDWNDSPYEHNAGTPYDTLYNDNNRKEYTIIQIPFYPKSYNVNFPKDWGRYGDSPFCVDDINAGAVAWLFDYNYKMHKGIAIYAGDSPEKFRDALKQIELNNPDWEYYSDTDD